MSGLEELKAAYKEISAEYNFRFSEVVPNINPYDESYMLVFKYDGIEINMSFSYSFIVESSPRADDLIFTGNPLVHFSIASYLGVTNFIQAMQKNRADKDTMKAFMEYLEGEK